jgi:hypothetical protein
LADKEIKMKLTSIAKIIFCLALLICWGNFAPPLPQAAAAGGHELEEVGFVFHTISWGMVRGQTARFTIVNPNTPDTRNPSNGQARCLVALYDGFNNVIAQSEEVTIPPGEFRSVDFNRDTIGLAGEPGTGRVQTRGVINVFVHQVSRTTTNAGFPTSLEVMDNGTAETKGGWYIPLLVIAK